MPYAVMWHTPRRPEQIKESETISVLKVEEIAYEM